MINEKNRAFAGESRLTNVGNGRKPGERETFSGQSRRFDDPYPNRLSSFYGETRPEEKNGSGNAGAGKTGGKNTGLGKIGRLFSGDPLSSAASLFSGTLSNLQSDDVLLMLILFLLFNERREDDYLVMVILGALLLS